MELWNVGDRSEAICPSCADIVPTTFLIRAMDIAGAAAPIDDVLVAVCDQCGATVGIPPQSTPRLREALEREPAKLAARVNRKLEDALRLIAAEFHVRDRDFRSVVMKYYLVRMARQPRVARRVASLARSELSQGGRRSGRVEIRLPQTMLDAAWAEGRRAGLRTPTELVGGVIALATEDVLRRRAPKRYRELREVASLI